MTQRLLLILLLLCSVWTSAQSDGEALIEDLSWMDQNHMQQQVEKIDLLAQTRLGSRLREDRSDLDTLQRIVDDELIARDDRLQLQALGAVLGNVMVGEVPHLEWKIYEDQKGRSRALCVEGTRECLFPITMLSRRMEVGLNPDVNKIYHDALRMIEPVLPKLPYGGSYFDKE